MKTDILNNRIFDSRTDKENVNLTEIIFGYLLGPALSYLILTTVAGNYLVQFYTDVIGVSGIVITVMPFFAKIFSAFTNLIFGKMIDGTRSSQGKARPWILLSGILLTVSGILLYAIPKASFAIQMIWIVFSYNLFFVGANNIYLLAHTLMLPRSTRNSGKRDTLALVKNVAEGMIPGTLSAVIMPLLVRHFGVGEMARSNWFSFMLVLSVMAIPGTLLEYYFTRERVEEEKQEESVGFRKQLKDCLHYQKWLIVMALFVIRTIDSHISGSSLIYFSNWVMADSVAQGATKQVLLNVIGQFPMGIGILGLMPMVKKYGKYKVMKTGFLIACLGAAVAFIGSPNMTVVLSGLFIKSIGAIVGYLSMSLLSDVIDEFEKDHGYRCDTFSITVTTIISMLGSGIAQSLLLLGINIFDYIAPQSATQIIVQNNAIKLFFNFAMNGVPFIGCLLSYILLKRLNRKVS